MRAETEGRVTGDHRVKLSVDVDPAFRRRLRLAAVRRDVTLREFLIRTIEERLAEPGEERHD